MAHGPAREGRQERRSRDRKAVPRSEALLDAAVEYTFPASDPISIDHAFGAAREREQGAGENALAPGASDPATRRKT